MSSSALPTLRVQTGQADAIEPGSAARSRARAKRTLGRRLDTMRAVGRAEGAHHSMNASDKFKII